MSMYFMDGKTFLKEYINEDPKKVMKTQFVLVSSSIRKNGKYKDQIVDGRSQLFPDMQLIVDYDDYSHTSYKRAYMEQLDDAKALLATFIKYAIDDDAIIVFLCAKKEKKYKFFKYLQEYVQDNFDYHIYDYKKFKEGKETEFNYDHIKVSKAVVKVLKKELNEKKKRMLNSEKGRKDIVKDLTKPELKKELKKRSLYYEGMSKSEMKDTLATFM